MSSIPQCEDLAPYLRQKLMQDEDHSWQTAPYIHEKVRERLRNAYFTENKPLQAFAALPEYPYPLRGYSGLENTYTSRLAEYQMSCMQVRANQNILAALHAAGNTIKGGGR